MRINMALWSLEQDSLLDVMRRYQVAVVSHGSPEREEMKRSGNSLCELGYCPETQLEGVGVGVGEKIPMLMPHLLPLLIKS